MHVSVHCPDGCGITAYMDPFRLVNTDSLVKLQRIPQRCPCTHGFPLLCMLPRHSPWPPFHAPWHECRAPAEQYQIPDASGCEYGAMEGTSAECGRPPWDDSPAEECYDSRSQIEALTDVADAHRAVEHRGIGLTLMKDASTQWQLQHVRRKFGGVRHPHAWVPPGLHVVPPPHEDVQQKGLSSQRRRKPSVLRAASNKPMPGPLRRTAHNDNHCQHQVERKRQITADVCSDDGYNGACGAQDTKACQAAWAAGCCSVTLTSPRHHAKSRLGHNDRWHPREGQGRPAAQPDRMHISGLAQSSLLEGPWTACLNAEQPQASAGSSEEKLDNHFSNLAEHQAPIVLSEQHKRQTKRLRDVDMHLLSAVPDVKTDNGDPMAQGSHEQLLADIDDFIIALQRPSQAVRSPLQPAGEGLVHAAGAENALLGQSERSAVLLNMSGHAEGTIIASADNSIYKSDRENTLRSAKARLDRKHSLNCTGQQYVNAAFDDSHSNSKLSQAAARTGEELCEMQEESSAIWHDSRQSYSSKGVNTKSSGLFKPKGKTLVKTDQAVHKLHNLEDVAQASLDELEALLREQQLKLAGMGLLPDGAANTNMQTYGHHAQHRRRPQRSALHAMADALAFATGAY